MKILFLHIPKTGGTTIKHLINTIYPYYEIGDCYFKKPLETKLILEESSRNPQIKIIYGHFNLGVRKYINTPYTFFTLLRDPVERILSFYYYLKNNTMLNVKNMSFEDFFLSKELPYVPPFFYNSMTADLSADEPFIDKGGFIIYFPNEPLPPQSPPDLEKAKENMEKYFSVVGITEMFDETLFLLKKTFSWGDITYTKQNVSAYRPSRFAVPNHVIELIMEKNQLDIQLYDWAKKRLIYQIQQLSKQDQQELKDFKNKLKQNGNY